MDATIGGVSGTYIRRDTSGPGGELLFWGAVRYLNDAGHLYEYHPGAKVADVLELPTVDLDPTQGTLELDLRPRFAAVDEVPAAGAVETWIVDVDGNLFELTYAGDDTPSYVRLRNNGIAVATIATRHVAGERLRLQVHWGGRPTRPHLECNGWAMMGGAAWVAPTPAAMMQIGSRAAGDRQVFARHRLVRVYSERRAYHERVVSLGDSISYEPYGSGDRSWNRRFGLACQQRGYILVRGVLGDTLALMGARFVAEVVDQDATSVVVLGGVNDLAAGRTLAQMQGDAAAIYAAAAAAGVRCVACTILPFKGSAAWNAAREIIRDGFNAWLLAGPTNVDQVVDTAAALADPLDEEKLLAAYDSGDHVHPSNAGGDALADAIRTAFPEFT